MELIGTKGPNNKIMGDCDLGEQLGKGKRSFLLQLNSLYLGEKQGTVVSQLNLNLVNILNQYSAIFQEAQSLSP